MLMKPKVPDRVKTAWRYKLPISLYMAAAIVSQIGPWYYRSATLQADVLAFSPPLSQFLASHELAVVTSNIVLTALMAIFGIPAVKVALGKHIPLNENGLLTFLKMLEVPVQYKLDRFCQKIEALSSGAGSGKSAAQAKQLFLDITQPDKQIKTIVESIFNYYSAIDTTNSTFKVVLFFVKKGKIVDDPIFYYPRSCAPSTPINKLNSPGTAIMKAVETGKPVILDDIRKAPKDASFVRIDGDDRDGSLMCYPIRIHHINEIRMVLSVFTETPDYFKRKNEKIYRFVIEPFQLRLVIEYCLLTLKKSVLAQEAKHEARESNSSGLQV